MPNFLNHPLELIRHVYEILLSEPLEPRPRAVMVVTSRYVTQDLPLRSYRGLLSACHHEVKEAIQFIVATKQLNYYVNMAFSPVRPFSSLTWLQFPALSPTINHICIDVNLAGSPQLAHPDDHENYPLLRRDGNNFARQLFDYLSTLFNSFAVLLRHGNPNFRIMHTECLTVNLRTPTAINHTPYSGLSDQIPLGELEKDEMLNIMEGTLKDHPTRCFPNLDTGIATMSSPLVEFGTLRFATEGKVWAEGHNCVLTSEDRKFCWLSCSPEN